MPFMQFLYLNESILDAYDDFEHSLIRRKCVVHFIHTQFEHKFSSSEHTS